MDFDAIAERVAGDGLNFVPTEPNAIDYIGEEERGERVLTDSDHEEEGPDFIGEIERGERVMTDSDVRRASEGDIYKMTGVLGTIEKKADEIFKGVEWLRAQSHFLVKGEKTDKFYDTVYEMRELVMKFRGRNRDASFVLDGISEEVGRDALGDMEQAEDRARLQQGRRASSLPVRSYRHARGMVFYVEADGVTFETVPQDVDAMTMAVRQRLGDMLNLAAHRYVTSLDDDFAWMLGRDKARQVKPNEYVIYDA